MLAAECWTGNFPRAGPVMPQAAGTPEEAALLDADMRLSDRLLRLLAPKEGCAVFQAASAHRCADDQAMLN